MSQRLIGFLLRERTFVLIATAILALAGLIAWQRLPIDAFPDATNVQVMILTNASGLAPVDVEQQITFPIELAMQGLPGVREVRSLSKSGLSQVVVIFEDDVDTYFSRQIVFERLQGAKEDLPEWAEPEMGPISTGLGEIYQYTLESDQRSPMELRIIQDWLIAPRLRPITGVNEVNSFGGYAKQYQVLVDQNNLLKYGVTLRDVLEAVESNNATAGGDFVVKGWEQAYVRSVGLIRGVEDIEDIVLESKDGAPVFLKNVAEVRVGGAPRQGAVTRDGKGETVAGMAIMLKGSNSKVVVDRVKTAIADIQASLPKDIRISPFYDRTALIQACIRTVGEALAQGGLFVVVVIFLLLGNLRAAGVVALSLPLTAAVAFILMGWRGITANLMSLGGLAIAVGMVVDASIVVAENITRHVSEAGAGGVSRPASTQLVRDAVNEVARPVIFAVLIIVIVFLPLFTLEQVEGKMFKPLAATMVFALFGSLLVAFTVVPVLCSLVVREGRPANENLVVRCLKRGYTPLLASALRHRRLTIGIAAGLLVAALPLIPLLGTEFLPQLNEGAIAINVIRLPSASIDGSVAVGDFIEKQLLKYPEVLTVVTKTGRAEISEDPMGPEQSDVIVMLHPEGQWKTGRSKEDLVEAIRTDLMQIPGLRFSFSQPIALRVNELISGIKSDVAIKVFGNDLEVLKEQANAIAVVLQGIRGAEDVKVEQVSGFAQVEIDVDRRAIARHKINVNDINEIIGTAVGGTVATTVIEGQMRFPVVVRFAESARKDKAAIERILVPTPGGARVPLAQLARIRDVEAPAQISREHGMRRVVVECNVRGRDLGSFVGDVREGTRTIAAALPSGYFLRLGGQFENEERAMRRLGIVVPLSILLIFLMLYLAFDSFRSALLVMVNLPFALVGGILAIFLFRINLSVSAVIGFIAVFGIAVQNGTVLVTFFNQLRKQGVTTMEAIRKGCDLRFRPLLMTSLTALLGLAPMMYATGSGSEIQRPLAVVVMGGLATSLFLTMIVLPVLYSLVFRERR
jgi:cobalt-zinc-cadmium resistance protein CzcA